MSHDMNVAALCLQEVNRRRRHGDIVSSVDDYSRAVWQSGDTTTTTSQGPQAVSRLMPGIVEEGSLDDEREVDTDMVSSPPPHLHTADIELPPLTHSSTSPSAQMSEDMDLPPLGHTTSPPLPPGDDLDLPPLMHTTSNNPRL